MPERHRPVMVTEIIRLLVTGSEEWVLDATVGSGGHAAALLEAMSPAGRLIGLDQDPRALERARVELARFGDRVVLESANFRDLAGMVPRYAPDGVDAALLDLGVSSEQIDDPASGFSFQAEGPLSMAMDPARHPDAAELLNGIGTVELAEMLRDYGDVKNARRVAETIASFRPLSTTGDLRRAARKAGAGRPEDLARVFQAIRIAVNDERGALEAGLKGLGSVVKQGGRVAVLSYHSGEDRLVKRFFNPPVVGKPLPWSSPEREGRDWELLTRGALKASAAEVAANSRSRSARLRVARRVGA